MDTNSLILKAETLTWLGTDEDCPDDICAHGKVSFSIDGHELVKPEEEWALNASAIRLLRTLERNHYQSDAIPGEQLFPCCGMMYATEESDEFEIIGCSNGIDLSVERVEDGNVEISDGQDFSARAAGDVWEMAVLDFSTQVRKFYDASKPKTPFDDGERNGFAAFLKEWEVRHPR